MSHEQSAGATPSAQQSYFQDILDFHNKFKILHESNRAPLFLDPHLFAFRTRFMLEELAEFVEAHGNGEMTKAFDALIDLVYVALGTAAMMNLPFDAGWRSVHEANMQKIRVPSANDSKRGSAWDVVKPQGWVSPNGDLAQLLLDLLSIEETLPPIGGSSESTFTISQVKL